MIDESIMYSQVYEILSILGPQYIHKIPLQEYEKIKNKRKKDYSCHINNYEPIENQNLMKETIEFISFINLTYWADEKERKELMEIYTKNQAIFNEKAKEKYDVKSIFKNRTEEKKELIVVEAKKLKWYETILSVIKEVFKRK